MRLIFVVPPDRFDFYNYLSALNNHELILLWHVNKADMKFSLDQLPLKFSRVIFWTDFATPKQLLSQIKPDRIIFFEIIDQRQIALIVTAKSLRIPTFYLEHGAAGNKETVIAQMEGSTFRKDKLPYLLKRVSTLSVDILKSKLFYFSVFHGFHSFRAYLKYLKLPILMLQGSSNKVLSKCKFRERVPDRSIVFSNANFEQHKLYTHIDLKDADLTGVPFFDRYFTCSPVENDHIVYIDHPYLEENLLGWDNEHHQNIAETLFRFAEKNRRKIFIKLHPRSKIDIWNGYLFNKKYVQILQHGDFTDLYLTSKLILGFSSSLVNGFICAKKNVVLLGWHPQPQIIGPDFSKTGLCHYSPRAEELMEKFDYWMKNNLAAENPELHAKFLLEFNYPFDGKATERVIQTILSC